MYVAYASIEATDWRVAYIVNEKDILAPVNGMIQKEIAASIIIIILGIVFSLVSSTTLLITPLILFKTVLPVSQKPLTTPIIWCFQ